MLSTDTMQEARQKQTTPIVPTFLLQFCEATNQAELHKNIIIMLSCSALKRSRRHQKKGKIESFFFGVYY